MDTSFIVNPDTLIAGTAARSLMVELNISIYSGRRKDRTTERAVIQANGATSDRAASVYKALFAECVELERINKFQAKARALHYRWTLPWSDTGARLLPTAALWTYTEQIDACAAEFRTLVQAFVEKYPLLVSAAAFKLGSLFNRAEYPTAEAVAHKFSFNYDISPLPTSGDFRLDAEHEVQVALAERYQKTLEQRLQQASLDLWHQLHETLTHISDRLESDEDGKRKRFHDTLVEGAMELCGRLTQLNVTGDVHLEEARKRLEQSLAGVTPEDLRKSDGFRLEVKKSVDAVLSDFSWGSVDD
jgi:hypothetical protein